MSRYKINLNSKACLGTFILFIMTSISVIAKEFNVLDYGAIAEVGMTRGDAEMDEQQPRAGWEQVDLLMLESIGSVRESPIR